MPFPSYADALDACHKHQSRPELDFFMAHDEDTGLSRAQVILSVGAGDGRFEEILQKTGLLTSLRSYHAVEPDPKVSEKLKSRLPSYLPNVEIHHYLEDADGFEGASNTFDVIFMTKMIPYVNDKAGLIQKALTWLKDGGKLLIEMIKGGDAKTNWGRDLGIAKRLYQADNVAQELRALRCQFKEIIFEYTYQGHGQSRGFANLIFMKEVSDDEFARFQSTVDKNAIDGCEQAQSTMFIVDKPTSDSSLEDH